MRFGWVFAFVVGAPLIGFAAPLEEKRLPELAGTRVELGPYSGELFVWETGLELTVYAPSGATVAPKKMSGFAEIVRMNGKIRREKTTMKPGDIHLRADLDLAGAEELELVFRVTVRRKQYVARVSWRLADDRARRGFPM